MEIPLSPDELEATIDCIERIHSESLGDDDTESALRKLRLAFERINK